MSDSKKIITRKPYTVSEYVTKLIQYSFLIKVLSLRELKTKYTQTFFGIGWVFLQPLIVVIIYSVFFKYLIHINTNSIPYPAFVFSGLVLWYLFTGIVARCTTALIESVDLIQKVSFPKIIIILSKSAPVVCECLILLLFLFIVSIFNLPGIGWLSITSVFYFIQTIVLSLSIGILVSTIALKYRDTAHAIPFLINFGIWLTPVFFPMTIVPMPYRDYLIYLNPLAASIEGLRGAMFYNAGISLTSLVLFVIYSLLLFISFYYFIKFEKKIVENL